MIPAKSCLLLLICSILILRDANGEQTSCSCDGTTAMATDACFIDVNDGKVNPDVAPQGCECVDSGADLAVVSDGTVYVLTCIAQSTTPPSTTTTEREDEPEPQPEPEVAVEGACGATSLTGGKRSTFKGLLYFGSIWVILWTLLTIVVNVVFKEKGHHRVIGILEEIGLILLFIFLGFFSTDPLDSESFCKVTTILLHFFIVLITALFLFEANFARSMVTGKSEKNGSAPPLLNYGIPVVLALVPALISFFTLKEDYALGVHCFISVGSDLLWAFAVPVWICFMLAVLSGQLAFLACRQERENVDRDQLFWAFKCCKGLPLLAGWLISTYFLAAFALDMQKLGLAVLFLVMCLVLGPLIFVIHTFQYKNTARKMYSKTKAPFYKPCDNDYSDELSDDDLPEPEKELKTNTANKNTPPLAPSVPGTVPS